MFLSFAHRVFIFLAWIRCQTSWQTVFVEGAGWEYRLWNDDELLEFISKEFAWYKPHYLAYTRNIQRIDMARYFILYKYGGIYVDMDILCLRNFMASAGPVSNTKISVIGSSYKGEPPRHSFILSFFLSTVFPFFLLLFRYCSYKGDGGTQNAMMVTPANEPFWMEVVDLAIERQAAERQTRSFWSAPDILFTTGPVLLSDAYAKHTDTIDLLPHRLFNPHINHKEERIKRRDMLNEKRGVYTKHLQTNSWTHGNLRR